MTTKSPEAKKAQKTPKTTVRVGKFAIIGFVLTIFNYILYSVLANLIINNNDFLWLSTFISTLIATILAYILHSRITWKERQITKTAKYRFFVWNIFVAIAINPLFTQLFSLITPLYEFTHGISTALSLPFSFEFIQSTGAFALTAVITMILNYLFYDKFVFGKKQPNKKEITTPKEDDGH